MLEYFITITYVKCLENTEQSKQKQQRRGKNDSNTFFFQAQGWANAFLAQKHSKAGRKTTKKKRKMEAALWAQLLEPGAQVQSRGQTVTEQDQQRTNIHLQEHSSTFNCIYSQKKCQTNIYQNDAQTIWVRIQSNKNYSKPHKPSNNLNNSRTKLFKQQRVTRDILRHWFVQAINMLLALSE